MQPRDPEAAPSGDVPGGGSAGTVTRPPAGDAEIPASSGGLPVRPRWARALVLLAVFVCAACGLVYELELVAFGSYLFGNSVVQASIVLADMVFAMGVGSLAVKPLRHRPAVTFAAVEGLLALVGGLSVVTLYSAFAWFEVYQPALVVVAFVIGALIGAEIPLLMTMIQRIRRQEAGGAVADLFAADYVGALLGGLAFPFVLLPVFGQLRGALVVGALNAIAGVTVVLWLFRRLIKRAAWIALAVGMTVVLAALGTTYAVSHRFEVSARQALYADPIVYSQRSQYQRIVITRQRNLGAPDDLRLFLNGDLQFSSIDEYRYHESLVHPAMAGAHASVLVLGGGDGLAMREVLKYPDVRHAVEVELDPTMIHLARHFTPLARLNHHSLDDPRVHVVTGDAFTWLRRTDRHFDVIIVDMPDPDEVATAKLYSVEFYTMARAALAAGGRMVVQAGSPYFAAKPFWCIDDSIKAAGFHTLAYHVTVPSFGEWGFVLTGTPTLRLPSDHPRLRFLNPAVLRASQVFPNDRRRLDVSPSTLDHPRILRYERHSWKNY